MASGPAGAGAGAGASLRGTARPPGPPPWLRFSRRWPWVILPRRSSLPENGSRPPPAPGANATGSIPIDSYQDARLESYVAETLRTSPRSTFTRHLGVVAVIATSHDTAPACSQ